MILAEAISEAVVYRVLQQKERKEQGPRDQRVGKVEGFYTDHNRHMREILPKVQAVLVPPDPRGQVLKSEAELGWQD